MRKLTIIIICLGLFGQSFAQNSKLKKRDLKDLYGIMNGVFSSEAQSLEDEEFFHISLVMLPIWTEATDGYWLYVSQAMAGQEDNPYRVRVYHLYQHDDYTLVSQVYEIEEGFSPPENWLIDGYMPGLDREDVLLKEGCGIYLKKVRKKRFEGATQDQACPSNLRGATYTTSTVSIGPEGMLSWDQGWNNEGKQVWGAVKGGYRFDKIKAFR